MKKSFFVLLMMASALTKAQKPVSLTSCSSAVPVNPHFSRAVAIDSILKKYLGQGIPGIAIAVYSEEGWWEDAAGFARTEDRQPMLPCQLQYLQSVAKSYMATAIMKLREEGKIDLDAPITKYLPPEWSESVQGASKITVRMLLNHTSGIPEYSDDPKFVAYLVTHPLEKFRTEFILKIIRPLPPVFEPGSRHLYCNTNYELLALIADAITGDHARYITKKIFEPLGLKNTFYRNDPNYLRYPQLVNSYWDVLNNGRPANVTAIQKANVASFIGDDGMVATPSDAVKFLKGLAEGKLLADSSLQLMQQWVNDGEGHPVYGLGLVHYEAGSLAGWGHSGGGIGAGCILLYVPAKKTFVFMAVNVGTLFGGELAKKADDAKNEILAALLF